MARPKVSAIRSASRLSTGRVPGRPKSMAHASVFGSAPNAVPAPEKIFERVAS